MLDEKPCSQCKELRLTEYLCPEDGKCADCHTEVHSTHIYLEHINRPGEILPRNLPGNRCAKCCVKYDHWGARFPCGYAKSLNERAAEELSKKYPLEHFLNSWEAEIRQINEDKTSNQFDFGYRQALQRVIQELTTRLDIARKCPNTKCSFCEEYR